MSAHRRHWTLDPQITFLNHGSFGACPKPVLELQSRLRARLEAEPVRFMVRDLEPLLDASRGALARFVGAAAEDLVFVPNATYGVNSVLRSLRFGPGDELLTTDHEYNASKNALEFVAAQHRARVVVAKVPFPLRSPQQAVDAVLAEVTDRTRLLLIDHVTSQTGLILPIAELIRALRDRGVETLVDGAHGPGMVPLDLERLGAGYYTGNCHKWICAPKGAALLYVRRDLQSTVRPLALSHGANASRPDRSRFQIEFDWTGTHDPTPYLCVGGALRFMEGLLPGGWPELMAANRERVLEGRRLLCAALEREAPAPESMIGALASVPLPPGDGTPSRSPLYTDPLQDALLFEDHLEVPVIPWPAPPSRLLRISAQLYNTAADFEALAAALRRRL